MTDTRKIIRVFLASPGDLQEERRTAKTVVDEFNKLWADTLGCHIDLVGWEDTISQYGRPQTVINQDLARCELVIGMIWKRWGSKLSVDGKFTSGFEEEFETSLDSRRSKGRPEIALFFKEIDAELLRDPGMELQKVLDFKERVISGREILFEKFESSNDFERKIRGCVTSYVQKLQATEAEKITSETQTTPIETKQSSDTVTKAKTVSPLSPQGVTFLRDFLTLTESEDGEEERYGAVEVARFRLLANALGKSGNDENTIGVHDSNLLYIARAVLQFGDREKAELLKAGLNYYSSENAPLWHWYASVDGFSRKLFSFYTMFGPVRRRVGAFKAMRLTREPLAISKDFSRKFFLDSWFKGDSAQKVAALGYLSDCGLLVDLPYVKKELGLDDYQTRSAAIEAIIHINFREGRTKAIEALYELQPETIDRKLVEEIFGNADAISDALIAQGLSHRNSIVRVQALQILRKRKRVDLTEAERLLEDADPEVRYEAISTLVESGRLFSNERAQQILVKPSASRGLFGFGSGNTDETAWKKFQRENLLKRSDSELEGLVATGSIFDRDAQLTLCERHFKNRKNGLEVLIRDRFDADFEEKLSAMASRYGKDNQLVKDTQGLKEFITKRITREALDIFCKKGTASDLNLVREILRSDFVGYSNLDVEYLRRHGEWDDIPLIIAAVGRSEYGVSLLSTDYNIKYRTAARAIYAMSKNRFPDLLNIEMPSMLLGRLLLEASDRAVRELDDAQFQRFLHSEDESVRKNCALRIVGVLPKRRIVAISRQYFSSDEQRYYNAIHWLDLGVSVSQDVARKVASNVKYNGDKFYI